MSRRRRVGSDVLAGWLREFARLVAANRDLLTELDSAIGDADHGTNLDRGVTAVVAMLDAAAPTNPVELLKQVGMTLVSTVGGAGGPLYGTLFLRMAAATAEATADVGAADAEALDAAALDGPVFAQALRAGLEGVVQRGKAEVGDKTMVDALAPAVDALDSALAAGAPLGEAMRVAAAAAEAGRDGTIPMIARKGRASYLGQRSAGHQDPGATSVALLLTAAAVALADNPASSR